MNNLALTILLINDVARRTSADVLIPCAVWDKLCREARVVEEWGDGGFKGDDATRLGNRSDGFE